MFTETLTERQALASANITTINSGGTATITTGNGINMGILRRARAFIKIGTVTSTPSITFSLTVSATSGGSFTAVTGLTTLPSITIATPVAGQVYTIEISSDRLAPAGKFWLRAEATETAGNNCVAELLLIGDESAYKPANAQTPALSTTIPTTAVVAAV